jgi:Trk-type K+ transport system membrane component
VRDLEKDLSFKNFLNIHARGLLTFPRFGAAMSVDDKLKSNVISSLTYFKLLSAWFILCTLVGGAVLSAISPGVGYINAAFLATSAWGGTGLYSVEARDISGQGFVLLYILMYCGGSCCLLLPPMIFRRISYSRLRRELVEFCERESKSNRPIARSLVEVTHQCEMIDRALAMSILLVFVHTAFWLFFGTFIMYGINTLYDDPSELKARGFSKMWASAFLTATSFFNCGFVLTSDSLFQYIDKPGIYLWSSVLILVGNTCAPMCLRVLLRLMHTFAITLGLDKPALCFALDNPRLMTTHLFGGRQTIVLFIFVMAINVLEFVAFLAAELNSPEVQVGNPRPWWCPIQDTSSFSLFNFRSSFSSFKNLPFRQDAGRPAGTFVTGLQVDPSRLDSCQTLPLQS